MAKKLSHGTVRYSYPTGLPARGAILPGLKRPGLSPLPVKGLMSPHPFHREQPGDDPYVVAQVRTPAEILERLKAVWRHEHSSQQQKQDVDDHLADEIEEARGLSDRQASRIKKDFEKYGF